ncbi:hypothetical protein ABER68_21950 [Paenibacillus alvei]
MKDNYFLLFPSAELRSQDGMSSFKICSYDYAYPDADNQYDLDWHKNCLIVTVSGFKAEINEVILEGRLINHYIHELHSFSNHHKKKIIFEPLEPYFELTFKLNRRKKVDINGCVRYPMDSGTLLQFDFETDLTYVDAFIKGLESILAKFPSKI